MPRKEPEWNRLIEGDCIAGMQALPTGSVDLAFADPPFNIGYEYDTYDDSRSAEDYERWCGQWMSEVVRVLKPNGTFWLAIGDEFAAELKVLMTRELHLHCRSWIVWYYTFGVNCRYKFSRSHAHLFYMVKDPGDCVFNADDQDVRVPSARQLVYGDKRANPNGRLPDDTWLLPDIQRAHQGYVLRPQDAPGSLNGNEDTWYVPRVNGTFKERKGWHGCQMPELLLARIVRACSHPDDIVLDPFAGSGTTLAVAKKLKRRWIGFELSPEYAANARTRLEEIAPGDDIEGVDDPTRSAPATAEGVTLEQRQSQQSRGRGKSRQAKSKSAAVKDPQKRLL